METLFVTRDATLKQRENTLSITVDGQSRSLPIESIGHLVLLGESRLNTRLLTLCGKHGVRISVFDYYGYCKGCFEPVDRSPAGLVKLKQAGLLLDDAKRQTVAREVVRGAAHNMVANLRYYAYRGASALAAIIETMQGLVAKISKADSSDALMGIEGNLHQWYYSGWKHIDPALDFAPRVRRPPNNRVNCLISFLNQLTYSVVRHEASKTHLEETLAHGAKCVSTRQPQHEYGESVPP
jgi:CRISPR-associated protein Cas1